MKMILLLTALSLAAVQAQIHWTNCSSAQRSYEEISEQLKISDECLEAQTAEWTENQTADLLNKLNRLVDVLKKSQKAVCKDATPKECPTPAVQSKGGLVCVSADGKRYCKPMCNEGCDFSFLRISRLFETCSDATRYTWTTQYLGGNKLAVCNKGNVQIAGASTAYFPPNLDCWATKSNWTLEQEVINTFKKELSAGRVSAPYTHGCLMCG